MYHSVKALAAGTGRGFLEVRRQLQQQQQQQHQQRSRRHSRSRVDRRPPLHANLQMALQLMVPWCLVLLWAAVVARPAGLSQTQPTTFTTVQREHVFLCTVQLRLCPKCECDIDLMSIAGKCDSKSLCGVEQGGGG